jgi:hypothetical protein
MTRPGESNSELPGNGMENRITDGGDSVERVIRQTATLETMLNNNAAAPAMPIERRQPIVAGVAPYVSNAPSIAKRTSPMSRARRLGSFVRQSSSTRRSAAGVFVVITVAGGFVLLQWWNTPKQGNTRLADAPITISNSTGRVVLYHGPRGAADRSRIITGFVRPLVTYAIYNRGTVIASTNPGGRPKHLILGGGS